MFHRSGEMRLSSFGLLLILTAFAMTLFAQPDSRNQADTPAGAGYFTLSNKAR